MVVMIFVGLLVWRQSKDWGYAGRFLGLIGVLIGVGSFIYHATGTYIGQLLDVGAMLLFTSYALFVSLRRLHVISDQSCAWLYILTNAMGLLVIGVWPDTGLLVFGIQLLIVLALEGVLFFTRAAASYRFLIWALVAFGVGQVAWQLDYWRLICWPANHVLTGHGIWHIACAV